MNARLHAYCNIPFCHVLDITIYSSFSNVYETQHIYFTFNLTVFYQQSLLYVLKLYEVTYWDQSRIKRKKHKLVIWFILSTHLHKCQHTSDTFIGAQY